MLQYLVGLKRADAGELNGILPFSNPEIIMRSLKLTLIALVSLAGCAKAYPVKDSGQDSGTINDTNTAPGTGSGDSDSGGTIARIDADGDGFTAANDCDDSNAAINPDATEVCDGLDNNCTGGTDDGLPRNTFHLDADADGFGDPDVVVDSCESALAGYVSDQTDCDDTNSAVNPEATEICDSLDNDCNGDTNSNAIDQTVFYADDDGDGFGSDSLTSCHRPSGYVDFGGDCNDSDSAVNPVATEICDGVDNNCDGTTDVGAADASTFYADTDGDSYGNVAMTEAACSAPAGYVEDATDCDNTNSAVNPVATEICDGVDNNCDTVVDTDAVDQTTFYADTDGDGYGENGVGRVGCEASADETGVDGDCVDWDPTTYPGATERCDGVDNDCNGGVDDGATGGPDWFLDADGDGFGNNNESQQDCEQPSGYVLDNADCDDTSSAAYPGGTEMCDGFDNDCNGSVDEDGAVDAVTWYADSDADGFVDEAVTITSCTTPVGYSEYASGPDCNDSDAGINSGMTDVADDGIDSDCDGTTVDRLCIEPSIGTRSWELYLDNQMDSSDNAAWGTALASGTGTLCVSVLLVDADEWKIQGRFSDGTWLVTNASSLVVEATAMGVPFATAPRSWGAGSDAFGTITVTN